MTSSDFFFLDKSDAGSWRALNGLALKVAAAAEEAGLSRAVVELVNVRISQLNGCAFCLDLHSRRASEEGGLRSAAGRAAHLAGDHRVYRSGTGRVGHR